MKKIVVLIKKINAIFSSCVLILFYLTILPIGKIIFLINNLFKENKRETYWQEPDKRELDLESSY